MGKPSELDYKEKLNKTRENLYKKLHDIRDQFGLIEKIKVETIKKADELKSSTEHDLRRIEEDIAKTRDLASESKERLHSEIDLLKTEIKEKYNEMRRRITGTITPT